MHIFCVEQNYLADKSQTKIEADSKPVIFIKPPTALHKENTSFTYPEYAAELYCTCELVLRISKSGKNIPENIASDFYDSVTVGINFIAFDNEADLSEELFWQKTKGWNNSSVIGKWLPANDFNNNQHIDFCLYKNREMVQFCNSALMKRNFNMLISSISNLHTINIGDLIFTGTQVNIGELFTGDKLEAFIEDDSLLEIEIE